MGTVLKVGELETSTYRNLVTNPVPFAAGHITASWYSGNPNPNAVVSYLLNQLDGATTQGYNQYLEDYARITVPLLGTGTEADPYTFYAYPLLTRRRVNITAADFTDFPYLNLFHLVRAYSGVQVRGTVFWYNAANTQIWSSVGTTSTLTSSDWQRVGLSVSKPPQSVLNTASYFYFGVEIVTGMNASQNYYDVTGFRASPAKQSNFTDWRGTYWDGSTVFTQGTYTSSWASTPRASISTLVISEIASTVEETEQVEGLSVTEDVTGMNAATISGGSSQASITIPDEEKTPNYLGLSAEIRDDLLGNYYGRIRALGQTDATATTVDESLSLLNAWVTAPPMSGTLASVLRDYVALAEAPIRPFTFEDGVDLITANVPGFVGNLYDKVREFLAANSAELVTVNGIHVVRKMMRDTVVLDGYTEQPNVGMNLQETSQYVRVHWYDNEYVTNGQVFPLAANPGEAEDDVPEPTVYSVGAGETLTVDIQLRASLLTVNVPQYVSFVPDEDVTGTGIYTAVGSDSLPITPAQWAAGGGKIAVAISDDPSVLKVTITGANFPELAPFRLAMSSGSGNYYNALRITGTGVFIRDQYVDLATGALPSATGQEFAVECTNPYIATPTQAYKVGQIIAGQIQQQQDISFAIPTPDDMTTLGLLPGKKFIHKHQQFRIESATVSHHTITGNGVYALTVADYDRFFTRSGGMTVAQFDALYAGTNPTTLNFSLKPLLHRFVEV